MAIRSVFLLKTNNRDDFDILEHKGADKLEPLMDNTFRPRYVEGLGTKKEHFKLCAQLASHAKVYKVTRPRKGFLMDDLLNLVEKEF